VVGTRRKIVIGINNKINIHIFLNPPIEIHYYYYYLYRVVGVVSIIPSN
jgi:hypothetical protein